MTSGPYIDPEIYATASHDYVINEIRSEKRDLGAGAVTVFHYDYSSPGNFDSIHEIAKIGGKYMFMYSRATYGGDFTTELSVTRAIPF